jgi:hypothetical protein
MTASLLAPTSHPHAAIAELHDYLAEVATAVGVGMESCTVDQDTPVSAYIALDEQLPAHPGRDVALLWDETHGWSAAIETHCGEDLILVSHLGGPTVTPPAAQVARFVTTLRHTCPRTSEAVPPTIRLAGTLSDLDTVLRTRDRS